VPHPDPVATFRSSHELLRSLTRDLSADQLASPSYCDGWSIAQVASHLGSQSVIMGGFLTAALAGEPEPSADGFPAIWARWDAMGPVQQRDDSLAANEAHLQAIEAIDDETAAGLRISLFGGHFQLDRDGFARFRVVEHGIHTWDVAVALDPTATIAPAAVEVILGELPRFVEQFATADETRRLHVDRTDADEGWLLVVGPEPSLEPWSGQAADAAVRLTGEQLVRLVYDRLTDADQLDLEGVTLAELQAVFGPV
jgi:uncharacterized protein (TIGR03083 family)